MISVVATVRAADCLIRLIHNTATDQMSFAFMVNGHWEVHNLVYDPERWLGVKDQLQWLAGAIDAFYQDRDTGGE